MTKADLMAHWDAIVTDPRLTLETAEAHLERVASDGPSYLFGEYQVVTSGGSTGRRGVFVWDFEGWLSFGLARERPSFWLHQRSSAGEHRRAFVAASHATHPTSILPRTFAGSAQLGVSRSFPVTLPIAEIVAGLNDFQPTDLFSYPSMLSAPRARGPPRRAQHLASRDQLRRRATASRGPRGHRSGLRPSRHQPLRGRRGGRDRPLVPRFVGSAPQRGQRRVRVGRWRRTARSPVGTPASKLLVTNVVNHVMPLIRYEITDEVVMLAGPNPDPWTGRRIADVEGRVDDVFVYAGRIGVHPHLFRSALGRRREVLEFQVRQTVDGADVVVCARQRSSTSRALSGSWCEPSPRSGWTEPHVDVTVVDSIDAV